MTNLRMTSDLRRQLILGAAKRCFARNGFAGTTTKSVAAAAAISEGAAVQAFPLQGRALCRNPGRGMRGRSGTRASAGAGAVDGDAGRADARHGRPLRATSPTAPTRRRRSACGSWPRAISRTASLPGCFTPRSRDLIGPTFTASLERAIAAGDAVRIGSEPLNLFWFAHHTVLTAALTRLPPFALSRLRRCCRSRAAALPVHPPRDRT